jgi:hypothetical protein
MRAVVEGCRVGDGVFSLMPAFELSIEEDPRHLANCDESWGPTAGPMIVLRNQIWAQDCERQYLRAGHGRIKKIGELGTIGDIPIGHGTHVSQTENHEMSASPPAHVTMFLPILCTKSGFQAVDMDS